MKFLIMSMNILAKESLGRLARVSGNCKLMRNECSQCRYTPLIEAEVDQVMNRMEMLINILEGRTHGSQEH